jgi:aspartyl-tRNA(Asn)/glutamyl-tRNA(Gln) amidotransferase subunit B
VTNIQDKYEAVIGLEVHAQMKTRSKAFCSCSTDFNASPNTNICPVCLGHPGTLPVLNRQLVEFIIKLGIATNCSIRKKCIFARKNYLYPDLPKGYQISQYDKPICSNGYIDIDNVRIGITRIHMEEDAGRSIHDLSDKDTLVDLNRCGVPLIEIVSEPDIRTTSQAHNYLAKIKQLVQYLGICDANMEEGSLRCDANVSVRLKNETKLGTKIEVKNLNSFKFVTDALSYEIDRQINILEDGGRIVHETLTYDPKLKTTSSMRSKEEAHDYRYFPEPDLVTVHVNDDWLDNIKKEIPELPDDKKNRFIKQYSVSEYDADMMTLDSSISDYFEETCKFLKSRKYKTVCNWIMTEVMRIMNIEKIDIDEFKISEQNLAKLVDMIESGKITNNIAKEVFSDMLSYGKNDPGQDPEKIVKEKNLLQVSDITEIEIILKKVLDKNPIEKERYLNGDKKLAGFFVGKVMKESNGKANPKIVNELLEKIG